LIFLFSLCLCSFPPPEQIRCLVLIYCRRLLLFLSLLSLPISVILAFVKKCGFGSFFLSLSLFKISIRTYNLCYMINLLSSLRDFASHGSWCELIGIYDSNLFSSVLDQHAQSHYRNSSNQVGSGDRSKLTSHYYWEPLKNVCWIIEDVWHSRS
jgi:hypothetical protein